MSAPTIVASSVSLPPEPYSHLVRLIPCLSAAAPAALEAWITSTGQGGVVSLHLYQRGALPPPPSYVPTSPAPEKKSGSDGMHPQASGALPDQVALVATLVFLGPSEIGVPTLGPAAPALPPGTPVPPPEPINVRTFSVQKVYEWMGYQSSLTGQQLPWAPVVAATGGAVVGAPLMTEEERLRKENEKLKDQNDWLCCLAIFCCCCNCCCD